MMFSVVSINDNTAFILLFPVITIFYIFTRFRFNKKMIIRISCILLLGICILGACYTYNDQLRAFANDRFLYKINAYIYKKNGGLTKSGFGDERIRAFEFAVEYENAWALGKGFTSNLDDPTTLENYSLFSTKYKTYVGISDLSGVVYIGGIWVYFIYCFIIAYQLAKMYSVGQKRLKLCQFIISLLLILSFTIYTTIYRSVYIATLLPFFCIILSSGQNIRRLNGKIN